MPLLLFKGQVEVKVIVPIKAALADRKKVVKLDLFSWAGEWAGAVQGQVAGVWVGPVQG